jgi:hypothetical protein
LRAEGAPIKREPQFAKDEERREICGDEDAWCGGMGLVGAVAKEVGASGDRSARSGTTARLPF